MNQVNSKTLQTTLKATKRSDSKEKKLQKSAQFLNSANPTVRIALSQTVDLATFRQTSSPLSRLERLQIVNQALVLLEQNYVHLRLKEAMHAVEPIQKLKLLEHQIQHSPDNQLLKDFEFHREMSRIFNSLRDLHTNYLLPAPYNRFSVYLPFEVEAYVENGKRRYLVSRLVSGFAADSFEPGVEVLYWNGIQIDRAVEINGARFAGSNQEALRARGIATLTVRPLIIALPPDEDWVTVGYKALDGQEKELKIEWLVTDTPLEFEGSNIRENLTREATAQGIDIELNRLGQTKKMLFAPDVVDAEKKMTRMKTKTGGINLGLDSVFPSVIQARSVDTALGKFGYLRIRTFSVPNAEDFVTEVIRLVKQLPQDGLIVDVRGNGGGLIFAGEQLLQVFTPKTIEPERLQFINTPLNLELCQRHAPSQIVNFDLDLSPWVDSIKNSVQTGATYSRGFPITSSEAANSIGQKYHGPVVLITDALCYSTTDIFAAGFQDHKIGPILGVDNNTGAGGANVWGHNLLKALFDFPSPAEDSPYTSLPQGSDMRVSIRRTLRVGEQAGTPVEDLGVIPDFRHDMTREDLLNQNVDLINRAAELLSDMPIRKFQAVIESVTIDSVILILTTQGISRLDVFVNGRPQGSLDFTDGETELNLPLPAIRSIKLEGYDNGELVASRKIKI
ncbi:MAG: S41 family peptidase [Prochloraceae cyanobacterium]|nr:S41 family peptidase [Prochloraceae cyanobacterium]